MNPKVSVIIPVYNTEQYLHQCVDSVLGQTLTDVEVILVDDESPDNCPRVCDEYAQKDSRVKVIHKKNGGLGFARNSGLEVAGGEYVAFLDSDDYVDFGTYGFLYDKATSGAHDVVYYKYTQFGKSGMPPAYFSDRDEPYEGGDVQTLMLDMIASGPGEKSDRRIECSACTALYKRSVIAGNHLSFHSERELISEDLIFNLDFLSHAERVVYNQSALYFYRVTSGSTTRKIRFDRFEKYRQFYDYVNANYDGLAPELRLRTNRFIIGHARCYLLDMLAAGIRHAEKKHVFDRVCSDPLWGEIAAEYPWKDLPPLYRLCFLLVSKKRYCPMYLMATLKHLCK